MSALPTRVLVVDDERDTVLTLGILFRSEGVEVEMLRNGADVVAKVARFAPDVVLLDIGMPGRDGFTVAQDLRSRYGGGCPALVALTGLSSAEDKLMAKRAGFDHHVSKPYDPQALLALVASLAA
jgi:CheY-like chemotaxis protein